MGSYTLKNLENLTGIKADTIRIWENRYGILKPHRTLTNRRRYNDDDLRKLLNIISLYNNGYKISRIAAMNEGELSSCVLSVTDLYSEVESTAGLLIPAVNDFDEKAVNNIILKAIRKRGVESAFTQVVFPILKKVGILWSTGSLGVGTEHFLTSIIRKRLIAEIDAVTPLHIRKKKKFILFLPEYEQHELGLLFYHYLILRYGHDALYLGQSTPLSAIDETVRKWNPGYVLTGILTEINFPESADFLKKLRKIPGRFSILAAGLLADIAAEEKLPRVYPVRTEKDLLYFIDKG